jgi:tetratricopeptide (TPR) repeat protein
VFGAAIQKYQALSASAPSASEKRYYDGQIVLARLKMDDLQGAQKDIGLFAKNYKDIDDYLAAFELEKGNSYFRKGDYKSAGTSFDQVTRKYDDTPSAPHAMYWAGKVLEASGKPADAGKQYNSLLKEFPESDIVLRTHLALGNLAYQAEQWDEAVRHYRLVVDDSRTDPALLPYAMNNLIETYEAAGVYDAALDLARKYLDRYPAEEDSFDKRVKIGILYQRLGYHEQSIVHLQDLLDEAGPDLEGEIRYYIAEAHFHKGDFQQAVLEFLKVPYLVTKKGKIDWTANSLYMAGQSYERIGRYDQAVTMYKQIIDRAGIDETFKAAARKEIDRVNLVLKKSG